MRNFGHMHASTAHIVVGPCSDGVAFRIVASEGDGGRLKSMAAMALPPAPAAAGVVRRPAAGRRTG